MNNLNNLKNRKSRRIFFAKLSQLSLTSIACLILPKFAFAKKQDADEAIQKITGGALVKDGRVRLVIPPLVENGNLVVLKVGVDSPMTASDYVKAIYVIAEGNPFPNIFAAYLTPRSGTANITTRVRLADSQIVWAIAQMNDGTFWRGSAETLVTLSACTEVV